MKIAIIAHHKFPLREPYQGGLEMITHALIKSLQYRGHKVDVYAKDDSDCDNELILTFICEKNKRVVDICVAKHKHTTQCTKY